MNSTSMAGGAEAFVAKALADGIINEGHRASRAASEHPAPVGAGTSGAAERMREAAAQVADEKVLDVEYEARDCSRSLHEQERAEIAVAKRIAKQIRALPLPSPAVPVNLVKLRAENARLRDALEQVRAEIGPAKARRARVRMHAGRQPVREA